jgi:hypothetical protein
VNKKVFEKSCVILINTVLNLAQICGYFENWLGKYLQWKKPDTNQRNLAQGEVRKIWFRYTLC